MNTKQLLNQNLLFKTKVQLKHSLIINKVSLFEFCSFLFLSFNICASLYTCLKIHFNNDLLKNINQNVVVILSENVFGFWFNLFYSNANFMLIFVLYSAFFTVYALFYNFMLYSLNFNAKTIVMWNINLLAKCFKVITPALCLANYLYLFLFPSYDSNPVLSNISALAILSMLENNVVIGELLNKQILNNVVIANSKQLFSKTLNKDLKYFTKNASLDLIETSISCFGIKHFVLGRMSDRFNFNLLPNAGLPLGSLFKYAHQNHNTEFLIILIWNLAFLFALKKSINYKKRRFNNWCIIN